MYLVFTHKHCLLIRRETDRQKEGERERGFQVTAIAVIGHLRPSVYTHSVLPSPPNSTNYVSEAFFCFFPPSFSPSPLILFINKMSITVKCCTCSLVLFYWILCIPTPHEWIINAACVVANGHQPPVSWPQLHRLSQSLPVVDFSFVQPFWKPQTPIHKFCLKERTRNQDDKKPN